MESIEQFYRRFNFALAVGVLLILSTFAATGQTDTIPGNAAGRETPCSRVTMPSGTVCLTKEAANAAARLARESAAKDEKIRVLEDALKEKDVIFNSAKTAADRNIADLKAALHRTEIDLAAKTGTLTACEANVTRQLVIIETLTKYVRPKKFGIIVF